MSYASFENDTVRVIEAKSTNRMYSTNHISMLFFISLGSSGVSSINTKPSIKLTAVVGNGAGVRKTAAIAPSLISAGSFSDVTPKTYVIYPTGPIPGDMVEVAGTIDQYTIFPS